MQPNPKIAAIPRKAIPFFPPEFPCLQQRRHSLGHVVVHSHSPERTHHAVLGFCSRSSCAPALRSSMHAHSHQTSALRSTKAAPQRSKIFQAWSRASGEFCFATEQNQLSVVAARPPREHSAGFWALPAPLFALRCGSALLGRVPVLCLPLQAVCSELGLEIL